MSRTLPLNTRTPIHNKTRIPDGTEEKVGHRVSNASHHFHKNGKRKLLIYQLIQEIHSTLDMQDLIQIFSTLAEELE